MESIPPTRKNEDEEPSEDALNEALDDIRVQVNEIPYENLGEVFQEEHGKWARMGLHPAQNIAVDQFKIQHEVEALIDIMLERLDIPREHFEERVDRMLLTRMIFLRRRLEIEQMKAQLLAPVRQAQSKIQLPPGFNPNA